MPTASEDVWNEAMALLLAWQSQPDDKVNLDAIRRFCAKGAEHRAAWDEARRVFQLTGVAVGAKGPLPAPRRAPVLSRRKVLAGFGAVAVGSAALAGPELWQRLRSDARTEIAEIRKQQLPDGSWLTIGPDSMVALAFTPETRRVHLLEGMALCEVARDATRPFEALVGDFKVTADNAVFEIRDNGGRTLAGVETGKVRVEQPGLIPEAVPLASGQWMAVGPDASDITRGIRDAGQTAIWRQRLLVADQEQIKSVVAEINRWHPGKIVIPQPALATATVSGLFDLSDPDAALAAVVAPYGGQVVRLSRWLTVLTSL